MTTKVLMVFLGIMLISGIGFASPLTDYSAGKVAIDLDWRNTEVDGNYSCDEPPWWAINMSQLNLGKSYSLDGGVTVGLGNKFAFQYNSFRPSGTGRSHADMNFAGLNWLADVTSRTELSTQQFNILYKMDDNISVFTGVFHGKIDFDGYFDPPGMHFYGIAERNIWQLGLVGSTKLGDKTTLYGTVGVGKDLTNWTAGLSYAVASHTEVNLSYRKLKVKDFDFFGNGIHSMDGEASGLGLGVTHKF